jgi:hypothetical protein
MSVPWKVLRGLLTLLWIGLCTALLMGGLATLKAPSEPENLYGVVVFHLGMRAIGFPLGFVAWYLLYGLFFLVGMASPEMQLWLVWLVVGLVGYIQWFHLMPSLYRQVVSSRKRTELQLQ